MVVGGAIDPLGAGLFSLVALLSLVDPDPLLEIMGAIPPPDLKSFPAPCPSAVPPGIVANSSSAEEEAAAVVRTFNYDVAHSARFTVFGAGSATVGFDDIFGEERREKKDSGGGGGFGGVFGGWFGSDDDDDDDEEKNGGNATDAKGGNLPEEPFSFVHSNLGYGPMNPNELVIFSPGLNTPHDDSGDGVTVTDLSAPMRVVQYVNVLGWGMAHLHTGTQIDQEPADIFPVSETLSNFLDENDGLLPAEVTDAMAALEVPKLTVRPSDFDKIAVVLSKYNLIDTPLKKAIRRLVDRAVLDGEREGRAGDAPPHLVLMMYSRASIEASAALREWKEDASREKRCDGGDVERCLRKAVTIATIGNGDRDYPDGPAYVHLSTNEDKLTMKLGVNGDRTEGGGRDALYLNVDSSFASPVTNNAHNFAVGGVQLLHVMMRHNGAGGVRELYDLASEGKMDTPENLQELVGAAVVATNCLEWVWDPIAAAKDVASLPGEEEARFILDGHFGAGTYDEISEANRDGVEDIRDQLYQCGRERDPEMEPDGNETDPGVDPGGNETELDAGSGAFPASEPTPLLIILLLGMISSQCF
mmetsp:Transcript_7801/g.22975  ORF Transcript_7801/g.22975 Transcript_7801/m.22975 type:complete len:587 (-) Transcript_7801:190-1950(-)